MNEMHPGQGFYVRIEGGTGANLRIEGMSVPITTPIPLHEYWNWVGYLPTTTLPITVALQSIKGHYLRVLSQDKTYDPAHSELSDLLTPEPSQGYLIHATDNVTLTYPIQPLQAGSRRSSTWWGVQLARRCRLHPTLPCCTGISPSVALLRSLAHRYRC